MKSSKIILYFGLAAGLFLAFLLFTTVMKVIGLSLLEATAAAVVILLVMLLFTVLYKFYFKPLTYGYTSFGKRIVAFCFDFFGMHLLFQVLFLLFCVISGEINATFKHYMMIVASSADRVLLLELTLLGIYGVYATILQSTKMKGTFAQKQFDIQVVTMENKQMTFLQSLIRNFFKIAAIIPMFWILIKSFSLGINTFEGLLTLSVLVYFYPKLIPSRRFIQDYVAKTKSLDVSKAKA